MGRRVLCFFFSVRGASVRRFPRANRLVGRARSARLIESLGGAFFVRSLARPLVISRSAAVYLFCLTANGTTRVTHTVRVVLADARRTVAPLSLRLSRYSGRFVASPEALFRVESLDYQSTKNRVYISRFL